jgi:hypothetical protein
MSYHAEDAHIGRRMHRKESPEDLPINLKLLLLLKCPGSRSPQFLEKSEGWS